MLVMVGRIRKSGRREKNGRLQRQYVNPKAQVAAQPHRLSVTSGYREREEAESEFGRLMLNGKITPAQYEAGKRYAQLAMRYRAIVLSAPSVHPKGVELFRIPGFSGGEHPEETSKALKADYDKAFHAAREAGNRAQIAVRNHAVDERKVRDQYSLDLLRLGLERLVCHFGIDFRLQITAHTVIKAS